MLLLLGGREVASLMPGMQLVPSEQDYRVLQQLEGSLSWFLSYLISHSLLYLFFAREVLWWRVVIFHNNQISHKELHLCLDSVKSEKSDVMRRKFAIMFVKR